MAAAILLNLGIFIAIIAGLFVLGVFIMVLRLKPTRRCPLCENKVDQDARRCRTCGYKFTRERGVA